MDNCRRNETSDTVLLGERPTFESQLRLAKFAYTKYRSVFPEFEHDDLYQHCCLAIWLAYNDFDWSRGTKWSSFALRRVYYELTFARSMLYGGQKRQGKKDEIILSHISYEDKEWQPSITYPDEMEKVYLREAVHKLKRAYRRIIIMYYGLQMSYREIGVVEGITRQCVQQKLSKAIHLLKSATGLRVGGV